MAPAAKPSFVDVSNPAMAIDCPNCSLITPRFLQYCHNCGYSLWPSGEYATAAFVAWRDHDGERLRARRFDLECPAPEPDDNVLDDDARAHELGIHVFPRSSWPFTICIGFFFLFLALVPFPGPWRIALGIVGAVILLIGIVGWVVLEDTQMYDQGSSTEHGDAAEHADAAESTKET
ncbi:MAG: YgaP family membrane protein [Candidatus Dormibacteraceae bacterium]